MHVNTRTTIEFLLATTMYYEIRAAHKSFQKEEIFVEKRLLLGIQKSSDVVSVVIID